MVGVLQYATLSRPEVSFTVNKFCQSMGKQLESQWVVVKRLLRCLKGTLFHGLHLQPASLA